VQMASLGVITPAENIRRKLKAGAHTNPHPGNGRGWGTIASGILL
jgi:hypothetical protein